MIYTVTLNPCLDYIMKTENLTLGETNRSNDQEIYPGGKGINVSIVLKNLGIVSKALGFVAGFTGDEIVTRLKKNGVDTDFITLGSGMSRINVKIKDKTETEINASGPVVTEKDFARLIENLDALKTDDVLVLTGNVPKGMSDTTYAQIMERCKNTVTVVDACGELLIKTLKHKPFLIKPNIAELEGVFGCKIILDDVKTYAGKLQEMGAKNVLVSFGKNGAALLTETGEYITCPAPKGTLVNSVGSGDSMVAGFLCEYLKTGNYKEALCFAIAAGSASAFMPHLADKEEILHQREQITV
ncbi:MAG: 1-phosphofructokinase [Clostridia bacterium]|nr:1-phosphofructokinase [Clostridia bacterium]